MIDLEYHELCEIFPPLSLLELTELAEDIRKNGQREPIVLLDGKILDGRNRYLACHEAGIDPITEAFAGADPLAFVVSRNLHRRHLSESQRGSVAARLASLKHGSNQHTPKQDRQICRSTGKDPKPAGSALTQSRAAELLNVSERLVRDARKVQEHGAPELVAAVDAGKVTVSDAAKIADQSAETQRAAVAAVDAGEARTVAGAAKSHTNEQTRSDGFDRLSKAIGAALRARDDLTREFDGESAESRNVLDLLRRAGDAANAWRRASTLRVAA